MGPTKKPGVLMLGIIHHAHVEFAQLSDVADVTVRCPCQTSHAA